MRDRDRWNRICIGLLIWAFVLAVGLALVALFPNQARGEEDRIGPMCRAFSDETARLAPLREQEKDEDLAHSLVPMIGPSEAWPTLHWQIRLIYRTPPEKLRAEALADCLRHHGIRAEGGLTVVLGIRG